MNPTTRGDGIPFTAEGVKCEMSRWMSENTANLLSKAALCLDCVTKSANKSRLAERNVGNTVFTSVRAACQPQLSFCLPTEVDSTKITIENHTTSLLCNFCAGFHRQTHARTAQLDRRMPLSPVGGQRRKNSSYSREFRLTVRVQSKLVNLSTCLIPERSASM